MKELEVALEAAARGKPIPLISLVDRLTIHQGITIERLVEFAVKHYEVTRELAYKDIIKILVH